MAQATVLADLHTGNLAPGSTTTAPSATARATALPNTDAYDLWWQQSKDLPAHLSGTRAVQLWASFGLPQETLVQLWALADVDGDGALSIAENRLAMHLASLARAGQQLPASLSPELRASAVVGLVAPSAAPATKATAPAVPLHRARSSTAIEGISRLKRSGIPALKVAATCLMHARQRRARAARATTDHRPGRSQAGRSGAPHATILWLSGDEARLTWEAKRRKTSLAAAPIKKDKDKDRSVDLAVVIELAIGRESEVFKRAVAARNGQPHLSLSLVLFEQLPTPFANAVRAEASMSRARETLDLTFDNEEAARQA